jgi:signal transduction histidine kinase/CheY-like chemotaxis protein
MRSITIFSAFASSILSNAISYNELKKSEKLLKKKTQELTMTNKKLERAYDELQSTQENLIRVEKLKALGEMAAGIAHDFNNVLAAILGRVQLLKMQIKPTRGKQEKRKSALNLKASLEVMEKASLDGAETVRRIQEFSRIRTDDKDFIQVNINELIENTLEFTKVRWKNEAESKGIKVKIKKEFSPLAPITGIPSELREVFTNLVNNALDAIPEGGEIRIKTFMYNNHAVVKIEDTGTGIPKDTKGRIFDPFFTTKGVKSTGLGLSVSYGIINRHRGTITAASKEGKGTIFSIRLPIPEETGKQEDNEEKLTCMSRNQKKARILVIEDEGDVRQLLSDILTEDGHEVEIASDGNHGIEMFGRKEFDLVLTDLGMPGMSGWQVAEKIKALNGRVPISVITGWNVELKESELKSKKVDFVIKKPFKIDQLLNLVQEGLILRDRFKTV